MFKKAHTGRMAVSLATVLLWGHAFAASPNDPYYQAQAQPTQLGLKQINPEPAWECSKGKNTVVAVLDSGLVPNEDSPLTVLGGMDFISSPDGSAAINTDPNGHGTHLTGIIAAASNNGRGIASVAPEATILPIRVLQQNLEHQVNGSGASTALSTIQGLQAVAKYSEDHQVNVVVNASFGSKLTNGYCAALASIAQNTNARVLVVAAAMNSGADVPHYPAYCTTDEDVSNLISVGSVYSATPIRDRLASYSNRGCWVNAFAPGSGVISTWPPGNPPRSGVQILEDGYATWFGTSQAAAFVSGAAAVLWSMAPDKSPEQIIALLRQSTDPVFNDSGEPLDDCPDPAKNKNRGRINLGAAMDSLTDKQCTVDTDKPPEKSPPLPPAMISVEAE